MIEVDTGNKEIEPPPSLSLTQSNISLLDKNRLLGFSTHDKIVNGVDISSSSDSSSGKTPRAESVNDEETETESLTGQNDTKIAAKLRWVVVLLFLSMCVVVPILVYRTTRGNETDNFESSFTALAGKVIDSVELQLASKLSAVDSFRISVTSYALDNNATWPFVTIPDYDLRGESVRKIGDVLSIKLHPLVTLETKDAWEEYSEENIDWLWKAQDRYGTASRRLTTRPDFSEGFSKEIFRIDIDDEYGYVVDETVGPYFPTWQVVPPTGNTINFNTLSHPVSRDAVEFAMSSRETVMSRIENVTASGPGASKLLSDYYTFLVQDHFGDERAAYDGEPTAQMFTPIFDTFETSTHKLVGMLEIVVYFEHMFTEVIQLESVLGVIENSCGDIFSYQINGEDAVFLGMEDLHDPSYDYIGRFYNFSSIRHSRSHLVSEKSVRLNDDYCPYSLRIYPTDELYSHYITNKPITYAVATACVVFFISIVSLTYDYIVQRRMRRVLKSAKENRAIVTSLFPANVRDRLLKEEEDRKDQSQRRGSMASNRSSVYTSSRRNSNENGTTEMNPFSAAMAGFAALAPPKMRLKFFLHEDTTNTENKFNPLASEVEEGNKNQQSKPIADLFPQCTVLFADIAGFTAWSSEREPEQVFTLLQTIFQSFDHTAKKRDIFKVETIGDCYVAVTGLPDPQADHAVRMTKFARACMHKMYKITQKLEVTLGPGTGDLRMRIGMHSGPVTAGVLRGEKSRFQLFGDTVNTASRIESLGQKGRIHVSQATAQLLIEAGKDNWIQIREDVVHAKGKGAIQTYWVLSRTIDAASDCRPKFIQPTLANDCSSDKWSVTSGNDSAWGEDDELGGSLNAFDDKTMLQNQYDRLIDWQVDMLLRLLKQIVAGRDETSQLTINPTELVAWDRTVLEEVVDSVELPKFDPEAARARATAKPNLVLVPTIVIAELREYVRRICSLYRDNPFHNFSHANHVTMSANKLLSRIVKPEDVNYHRKSVKDITSDLHDYTFGITSDPLTQFAVMFSTLIHDVDHTGVSNAQRSKEDPTLAGKYKNRSVAEQNSVDIAWELLMDPAFENLQRCIFSSKSELLRFRQLLVNLVMATDIFDKEMKATRNMRWDKVFHSDMADAVEDTEFRNLKATIVIEHIIQAADVAHTMQHWQVYKKWNTCLFHEMYEAYEIGRSENDPSEGWYNGELWFFDNYIIPLARKLEECGVFGVASEECLNYALENRKEWAVKGKAIVQEMLEDFHSKKKESLSGSAVFALQEDEIMFAPKNDPPSPRGVEKARLPLKAQPVFPIKNRRDSVIVFSPPPDLDEVDEEDIFEV